MNTRSFIAFILMAVTPMIGSARATGGVTAEQIDAIFADLKSDASPGAAVLVLKDGEAIFERGYGITDLKTRQRIDGHTNFRLASLSKQFTAMSIMLLVHDGKLHYEDHLSDIFPEFPAYGKAITIRQLLNHTSGLLDYEDLMEAQPNRWSEAAQIQDAEVLALLEQQSKTKFAPGTHWEYSNSGYVVLGMVVAKVSGSTFSRFLHDRIFAPLKMDQSLAFEKGKNEVSNRAYGHTKAGKTWQQTDQSPTSATLGDGGIYTSLEDMAKWDAALREHTLLSAAEMQPALSPVQVPDHSVRGPDNEAEAYGFGWYLKPYKGHARMWHYGETMGFRTNIQRFPKDQLTVIILANRAQVNPGERALKVADLYLK